MGWTPAQVDACSVWQFHAAAEGYRAAHGGSDSGGGEGMDEDRLREIGIEGF